MNMIRIRLVDSMNNVISLAMFAVTATASADTIAYDKGPEQLAVSFMTQFYEVEADAVQVKLSEQTHFDAKVRAEANGHVCIFDAQRLPTAKYGWAAKSMTCDNEGAHGIKKVD